MEVGSWRLVEWRNPNFSSYLPQKQKDTIKEINKCFQDKTSVIKLLPSKDFAVELSDPSRIHWTTNTAVKMMNHWTKELN